MKESGDSPQPPQRNESPTPAPLREREGSSEKKFLRKEMAGAQALALLGGMLPKPGQRVDKSAIDSIAKGGPLKTEKVSNSSRNERDEYWNSETSAFKNASKEDRMKLWEEQLNNFLGQYKDKPEEEFLRNMGISTENGARQVYEKYIEATDGDVGSFVSAIAQNNTAEQIEQHRELIQRLGNIYGANASKITELLIEGIKNVQADPETFITEAEAALQKGDAMPGIQIFKQAELYDTQWSEKQRQRQKEREEKEEQKRQESERQIAEQEEEQTRLETERRKDEREEPVKESEVVVETRPESEEGEQEASVKKIQLKDSKNVVNEMREAITNSESDTLTLVSTPDILIPFIEKEISSSTKIKEPIKAKLVDNPDKTGKQLIVSGKAGKFGQTVTFNVLLENDGNSIRVIRRPNDIQYGGAAKLASERIENKLTKIDQVIAEQINDRIKPLGTIDGIHIGDGVIECKIKKTPSSSQAA